MEKFMNKMDNMEMDKVAGGEEEVDSVILKVTQILWQQMYLKRKTQALVLVNNSDIG